MNGRTEHHRTTIFRFAPTCNPDDARQTSHRQKTLEIFRRSSGNIHFQVDLTPEITPTQVIPYFTALCPPLQIALLDAFAHRALQHNSPDNFNDLSAIAGTYHTLHRELSVFPVPEHYHIIAVKSLYLRAYIYTRLVLMNHERQLAEEINNKVRIITAIYQFEILQTDNALPEGLFTSYSHYRNILNMEHLLIARVVYPPTPASILPTDSNCAYFHKLFNNPVIIDILANNKSDNSVLIRKVFQLLTIPYFKEWERINPTTL